MSKISTSTRIVTASPDAIVAQIPPDVLKRVGMEDVAAIATATSLAAVREATDIVEHDHLVKVAKSWAKYEIGRISSEET